MVAEKGIPALRQYGARLPRARRPPAVRPSPACRAPVARLHPSPACRAPVARLSRARRPPVARPSPACRAPCRAPVARLSRARRPPVARPSPAYRVPVARLSRARRPPVARPSPACRARATGARQGPDRHQTFNIIIIILLLKNFKFILDSEHAYASLARVMAAESALMRTRKLL